MPKQVLQVSVRTNEEIEETNGLTESITDLLENFKESDEIISKEAVVEICELTVLLGKEVISLQKELRRLIIANVVIENEALKGE